VANDCVIKASVMLNPVFLGKGIGSKVIKLGIKKFIMEKKPGMQIIAEIKKDNVASIKAFEKAGFKENHVTYSYDYKILTNEKILKDS
jgi:L-amino acid N-acyltransferase YncA